MKLAQQLCKMVNQRSCVLGMRSFGNNMARGPTATYQDDEFLPENVDREIAHQVKLDSSLTVITPTSMHFNINVKL
jgi:hypothetical protein